MKSKLVSLCMIITSLFLVSCTSMDEKITKVENAVTKLEEHQLDEDDDEWVDLIDDVAEARNEIDEESNNLTQEQLNRFTKIVDKAVKLDYGHQDIIKLLTLEQTMFDNGLHPEPEEAAKFLKSMFAMANELDNCKNKMSSQQYTKCLGIMNRIMQEGTQPRYE